MASTVATRHSSEVSGSISRGAGAGSRTAVRIPSLRQVPFLRANHLLKAPQSMVSAKASAVQTAAPSIEIVEADAIEQLVSFTAFDLDEFVAGKSKKWTFWNCEPSEFPWVYSQTEYAYVLQGQFYVTYEGGEAAEINAGDFVKFPPGNTQFRVTKSVKKFFTLVDE